jgi:hypothetical protein
MPRGELCAKRKENTPGSLCRACIFTFATSLSWQNVVVFDQNRKGKERGLGRALFLLLTGPKRFQRDEHSTHRAVVQGI